MTIIQNPSNNYSSRNGNKIQIVVIHWTAGSLQSALNWFSVKASKVSAHYVIDYSGQNIYQCVQDENNAWHAGYSKWKDHVGCNSISIGIELVGPPTIVNEWGWSPNQINSLVELTNGLLQKYPTIKEVTDHSTIRNNYIEYAKQNGLTIPPIKYDVLCGIGIDKFPWDDFQSKLIYPKKSILNKIIDMVK